ncbi:PIG-L domain-containing protein [Youhaiella tibetensis]|uniref:PIG-L family deacetylase n=1 Tax=Paradevosia tibetensis TaxID=1447062 RepID=A0A5B9DIZ3_9HYPH|nr:PIG-L family deacetylase [Youhaiella tibetensis]QEE19053.1 PIG-L family deacetylase [Youhaiella tibetensis]GGF36737.1 PIG-L domain-containing protein [Youhaiella tibetensis]
MLSDRERLARQQAQPALVTLHRALSRLRSVLTVMNTGAHPDDEQSGMLAYFRYGLGMRVVVACSTRGEGGQNSLGPERTAALGIMRTREMEEAARVLDADIAWLGHGPDDPVHDFGFSKSGEDTLGRWGRERTLERLVRAYRTERPDIVIPTFLDVPGQHGHHRAMTEAAEAALELAADPEAFPEHFEEGLSPWTVAKYYLPAWSGGGGTYDDEVPPPPATLIVEAAGRDEATGAAYDNIGEWSRARHASQGMGFWREPKTQWPLHLLRGAAPDQASIKDNLPDSLAALDTGLAYAPADALRAGQMAIDTAIAAFPDAQRIIAALGQARDSINAARQHLDADAENRIGHRLERKLREIDAAILTAAGVTGSAWAEPHIVAPGGRSTLSINLESGRQVEALTAFASGSASIAAGEGAEATGTFQMPLEVSANAELSTQYAPSFSALGGNGEVFVMVEAEIAGRIVRATLDLDEPFQIAPAAIVAIEPDAILLNLRDERRAWPVDISSSVGEPRLETHAGFHGQATTPGHIELSAPTDVAPGRYALGVLAGNVPGYSRRDIAYPHIGRTAWYAPQRLDVLALDLALPDRTRVGYVGGGADNVGIWLERMGLNVTWLDREALQGDLSAYSTIVVGIFAFGLRPDLAAATERLHDWVQGGGHLVTLYHRPSDGWDPTRTPPRRLVIGSPSLRWRVTDPEAPVTILDPGHPLLNGPNRIGPGDWAGWDKERGLYFASEWDDAYEPLVALNDKGETALKGALLSARVGTGRHTHTALGLQHQMDRLVPGAFRLMANLCAPASQN